MTALHFHELILSIALLLEAVVRDLERVSAALLPDLDRNVADRRFEVLCHQFHLLDHLVLLATTDLSEGEGSLTGLGPSRRVILLVDLRLPFIGVLLGHMIRRTVVIIAH